MQATLIAESVDHRNQSWDYTAILRVGRGDHVLKVHIRTSNRAEQSENYVASWGPNGWNRFYGLPADVWWSTAPGYTKRELSKGDWGVFRSVRDDLLEVWSKAIYGFDTVEIKGTI